MKRAYCLLVLLGLMGLVLPGGPPQAQAALAALSPPEPQGPGWHHVLLTTGVSPAEARRALADVADDAQRAELTARSSKAAEITPEIVALARALQHDPRLIFDYVHNHIDYLPLYGTLNGAAGTLLAGRGTDADQAALFIAMMRASGYSATYVVGDVTYSADRLANWVGAEASQAGNLFLNGGIPIASVPGGFTITRVWAEAEVGGVTYTFDPAMKVYKETAGLDDLGSVLGYDRAAFLSRATSGATTTSHAIADVNEVNIQTDLTAYAMELIGYIDANLPGGGVADVVGGREIVGSEMAAYPTSLPEALSVAVDSRPVDLGVGYNHTLRIEHAGIDHTLNTFQLADRRVTIFYDDVDHKPVLRIDGVPVVTGTATISGTFYAMTVTVDHPYAPGYDHFDQIASFSLKSGSAYALLHDLNTVSPGVIAAGNRRLAQAHHEGLDARSEAVLGEALALVGWSWLHQVNRFADLSGRIGDVVCLTHHQVGIVGQEEGLLIDVPMGMVSDVSTDGLSDTWAVFRAQTMFASALEHGVLEQLQGTPSASTIKLLSHNNANGDRTFLAGKDNWAAVKPQLQNYSTAQLVQIETSINQDHTLLLPEYGDLTLNDWQGAGYIDDFQSGDEGSMGMIISGGYYGGYGTLYPDPLKIGNVIAETWAPLADQRQEIETPEDSDPIDMATGAFHDAYVDLSVGPEALLGLTLERTYTSGDPGRLGPLGYGWHHNYEIALRGHSDGVTGLGARGPKDAAALIAYAHVAIDLLGEDAGGRTLTEWMATALATRWAMDRLIDNARTIEAGGTVLQYIRLPGGTFAPPPGVGRALKEVAGNRYALQGAGNDCLFFDSEGRAQTWQDANGNVLTFAYDGGGRLQTLATGTGMTFTLAYSGERLVSVADQAGRSVGYTYTAEGELATYTSAMGHTWSYAYDAAHHLTSVTRPEGNTVVTNAYDDWGRVMTQTDALGNMTTLYISGYRNGVQDPGGALTLYFVDDAGRLRARQDPAGNRFTVAYNGAGQRTAVTDRMGDTAETTYHPQSGYVASTTGTAGEQVLYAYEAQTLTFTATDVVTFTFYQLAQVTQPNGSSEAYTYDARGNPLTYTNGMGKTWRYGYGVLGRVTGITNPVGGIVTYTYHTRGALASSIDTDTGLITVAEDAYGRPVTLTHGLGSLAVGYDLGDRVTSVTDELGRAYTYTYDTNGNLIAITDPAGYVSHYAYNAMDRIVTATNRLGAPLTLAYDELNRPASVTDANGHSLTFSYDARGWFTGLTDPAGHTWELGYDDEGVMTSLTTPLGNVFALENDQMGRLSALTDPQGHTTAVTRDVLGYPNAVSDALGREVQYGRDPLGLLTSVTAPVIGTVTYGYNDLGLLSAVQDLNGQAWLFDHTPMGRLRHVTDPLGRLWQYTYDQRGRLHGVTYPDADTQTLTYDAAGNLTQRAYSGGLTLAFAYDLLDRLVEAEGIALSYNSEGQVVNTRSFTHDAGAAYDTGGRLEAVTYAGGQFTVTYTYNNRDQLVRVADSLNGTTVAFEYDADGRLVHIRRANGVDAAFSWDTAARLTRLQEGTVADMRYAYNAAGDLVQETLTLPLEPAGLEEQRADWTYDEASQVDTLGYTYDQHGRQVTSPDHNYTWDSASRLTGIDDVTLTYNGLGDLATRTETGHTTHYIYNAALDLHPIVAEWDEDAGAFRRYYIWTPGGELLYMIEVEDGNALYFYHFDKNGSTLFLTGASGAVTDAYAYTPYGILLDHQGTNSQPFTFLGERGVRQEGSTGLYHMRLRYYDAYTARFLSRDPVWVTLSSPKRVNPYQYAQNDPLGRIDVTGASGFGVFGQTALDIPGNMEYTPIDVEGVGLRPETVGAIRGMENELRDLELQRREVNQGIQKLVEAFNAANRHEFDTQVREERVQGAGEVCDGMGDMLNIIPGSEALKNIVGGVLSLGSKLSANELPGAQAAVKEAGQQVQRIKDQINAHIRRAEELYGKEIDLLRKLGEVRQDVKLVKMRRQQTSLRETANKP